MRNCSSQMQLTRAADYGVRVMIHLSTLPRANAFYYPLSPAPPMCRRAFSPKSFRHCRALNLSRRSEGRWVDSRYFPRPCCVDC